MSALNEYIIKSGNKQYKLIKGQKCLVDKLNCNTGDIIDLPLLFSTENGYNPSVIKCKVVNAKQKGDKIVIFKKNRRKNYDRKTGYRHLYSCIELA